VGSPPEQVGTFFLIVIAVAACHLFVAGHSELSRPFFPQPAQPNYLYSANLSSLGLPIFQANTSQASDLIQWAA
jgi:hypothetical protein